MTIRFYQVACGDAARLKYDGEDGKPHFIFLDSGYERTYRDILANEIKALINGRHKIDLWIISHIHDDHIGGVLSYIRAISQGEIADIVSTWWYNPPYHDRTRKSENIQISQASSFVQGRELSTYLSGKGTKTTNITNQFPITDMHGLRLTILSPTREGLHALKEKYKSKEFGSMNYHELTDISEPKAIGGNDYANTLESFDIDKIEEDTSIENGSSIAAIIEYDDKRVLWLGDAFSHVVIQRLKNLGYSHQNPLIVDLVKVSHHGSSASNSNELFSIIRSKKYLFSANGDNKHFLPAKECIARILRNKFRKDTDSYELIFTHDTEVLREIFKSDGSGVQVRWNFKLIFPDSNKKWIDIKL